MKKYLSLIVIAILFVGCDSANDLGTPFTKGQKVTLSATIGDASNLPNKIPNKNRVTGIDNKTDIQLVWDEGDQIKVIVGDKSAIFTLTSGASSSDGAFTGKMPADGTNFRVEYPISEPDISTQTYIKDGFSNGLMKMVAENGTIDDGFILKAQYALLGLQLIGNQTLGKIILKDLSGEQTYTLNCEEKLKENEATIFYIVVPVEGWENGMLVEVYDKDGVVILRKEKKGKMDLKTTEAMIMPTLEARGPGKRIGVFSVGDGKYVSFSQGNLQYIQSTKTWQFADNQWEILGEENKTGDRLDLFDWNTDGAGNFVDWGMNIIQSDSPKTWRTLSIDEWKYILHDRPNATSLLACAIIDNVVGVVILPEEWQCPEGVQITTVANEKHTWDANIKMYYFEDNVFAHNTIETTTWKTLEKAGAVFLPTAGFIKKGVLTSCGTVARTWSATRHQTAKGYYISFGYSPTHDYSIRTYSNLNSDDGHSVRLVHDTIP